MNRLERFLARWADYEDAAVSAVLFEASARESDEAAASGGDAYTSAALWRKIACADRASATGFRRDADGSGTPWVHRLSWSWNLFGRPDGLWRYAHRLRDRELRRQRLMRSGWRVVPMERGGRA